MKAKFVKAPWNMQVAITKSLDMIGFGEQTSELEGKYSIPRWIQ